MQLETRFALLFCLLDLNPERKTRTQGKQKGGFVVIYEKPSRNAIIERNMADFFGLFFFAFFSLFF